MASRLEVFATSTYSPHFGADRVAVDHLIGADALAAGHRLFGLTDRAIQDAGVCQSAGYTIDSDALVTAAAIVVFWPAAFFVGGDGQTAAELASLKGQFEALERTGIEKMRTRGETQEAVGLRMSLRASTIECGITNQQSAFL